MEFHDYAIEALINSDICRGYKDYLLGELRKAEKIVTCKDSVPTEDVRPVVRGVWVGIDEEPHEEYECSVCGRIVEVTSANIKPEEEYPYCHCGADMREVEE